MIEIDGAYGEGGGPVLRTALALAVLTCQSTHLCNVRTSQITAHLRMNAHIIRQFVPVQIEVEDEMDGYGTVTVRGTESF